MGIKVSVSGPHKPASIPLATDVDLAKAIKALNKKLSPNTILPMDEYLATLPQPDDAIPTGALALDVALHVGGIPRGRITELYGPESSGKTTLCQSLVAQCQAAGGTACYIDMEYGTDPEYMRRCGIDTSKLLLSHPANGTEVFQIIDALIGRVDLIIIDSVAAIPTEAEREAEPGSIHVGQTSRLLSQELRRLNPRLGSSDTALVFVNQIREKIGVMFGTPERTPGGRALKFYASLRLDIRQVGKTKEYGNKSTMIQVRVTIKKSKVGPPMRQAMFHINGEDGVDFISGIMFAAKDTGALISKGGYFYLPGNDEYIAHGATELREWLRANPDEVAKLRKAVLEGGVSEPDPEEDDKDYEF